MGHRPGGLGQADDLGQADVAVAGTGITTRVIFNKWPQVKAGMESKAEAATAKAAMDMEAGMKARAPVDTGFLRNSIQAQKIGPAHWRVTVGAEYGLYVEYGTRFTNAQPYFFPTIVEVSPTFLAAMRSITG